MSIFALKIIDTIRAKQKIEKLVIDDKCQLDEFEDEVSQDKRNNSELGTLYRYIEYELNGNVLPEKHKKELYGFKLKVSEYRTKHLRLYAIKKQNGQIVILGGYKGSQTKDLRKVKSITNQLFNNPLIT